MSDLIAGGDSIRIQPVIVEAETKIFVGVTDSSFQRKAATAITTDQARELITMLTAAIAEAEQIKSRENETQD